MEEPGHAGHDDLAHVSRLGLLVGLGDVAVDRVAHLRSPSRLGLSLPPASLTSGSGRAATAGICQLRDSAPLPWQVSHVTRSRAAHDRRKRVARPRHDVRFHELDDHFAIAFSPVRINRIVGRIDDRRRRAVRRGHDDDAATSATPKPSAATFSPVRASRAPTRARREPHRRRANRRASAERSSSSAASCAP